MSKNLLPDERHRRPLYLYDLPPTVLESLSLKPDAGLAPPVDGPPSAEPTASQEDGSSSASSQNALGTQSCSLCGLKFDTSQEQKDHFKTDFHHYNLKQKLNGLRPVFEAEFERLVDELDLSISGSDTSASEDDEDEPSRKETMLTALLRKQASLADKKDQTEEESTKMPAKTPMLWLSSANLPDNTYYGVYKAMFTPAELENEGSIVEAIKQRQLAPIPVPKPNSGLTSPGGKHIFLCMVGGGHFAGMVVSLSPKQSKHGSHGPLDKDAVVLVHKTFHRYTTRRKQGGSQSANDNAKGAAHSAGASLRRYNEQMLTEDIRNTLAQWKPLIDTAELLFVRAAGSTNRNTLFGPYDNQVLQANDPRIRKFPFTTRRATKDELMRAFIELTRLKVREIPPEAPPGPATTTEPHGAASKPKAEPKPPAAPGLTEEQEAAIFHTTQLQALIRRSKLPALLSHLASHGLSAATFRFQPADAPQNRHAPTCLHFAAAQNAPAVVAGLLARAGADPTVRSGGGKTPFELAGDRATRDAFRVARAELGEAAWDWEAAGVPAPLRREEAEARAERERREEEERRRREEERVRKEGVGDGVGEGGTGKKKGGAGPSSLLLPGGGARMSARERREEEMRGLTPEQRMRVERERRARAAEERIRRLQGGGGS